MPIPDELRPRTPELDRTFKGHKAPATAVNFSPDMKQMVSSGEDHDLMLWTHRPKIRANRFKGHTGVVHHVEFSPTGERIASASRDRTVRLWKPTPRGEIPLEIPSAAVTDTVLGCSHAAHHPSSQHLQLGFQSDVLKGHSGGVRHVSFSRNGRNLITASDDKTVKTWSLPDQRFLCAFVGHNNWVRCANFSPDSRMVVSGGDDKTVKVWDFATRECVKTFFDHDKAVLGTHFHPDGTCVASCSADGTLKIWDVRSYQLVQHYPAHDGHVTSMSFHPTGNYLLSSSTDATVKVWDLREGRALCTIPSLHGGGVRAGTFSPDGSHFATAGVDGLVLTWKSNLSLDHTHLVPPDAPPPMAPAAKHRPGGGCTGLAEAMRGGGRGGGLSSMLGPPPPGHGYVGVLGNTEIRSPPRPPPPAGAVAAAGGLPRRQGPGAAAPITPPHVRAPQPREEVVIEELAGSYRQAGVQVEDGVQSGPTGARVGGEAEAKAGTGAVSGVADREALPEVLAGTLDHIVGQLDMLTRTISILEQRLTHTEDQLAELAGSGIPPSLPAPLGPMPGQAAGPAAGPGQLGLGPADAEAGEAAA